MAHKNKFNDKHKRGSQGEISCYIENSCFRHISHSSRACMQLSCPSFHGFKNDILQSFSYFDKKQIMGTCYSYLNITYMRRSRGRDRRSPPPTSIFQGMVLDVVKPYLTHPGLNLDPPLRKFSRSAHDVPICPFKPQFYCITYKEVLT